MKTETKQMEKTKLSPCPPEMQSKFDAKALGDPVARHGDLRLFKAKLPEDATPIPQRELLRSEITGHVHGIIGEAQVYKGSSASECSMGLYVVTTGPAAVSLHLDHKPGPLPVGVLEVRRKREATSDTDWVRVQD